MQEQSVFTSVNRRAVFHWAWVLFQAGWGAALAVILVFGPLSYSGWPVWAAGFAGAFIVGGLWMRAGRRLRFGLHLFNLAVVLMFGFVALNSLYTIGAFPPPSNERVANFDRLWRAMDAAYPYFEQKGVDWDAAYAVYAPRVAAAASDEAYRSIVSEMLAGLDDLHTRVNGNSGQFTCCFAVAEEIDGQAVITKAGPQATEAGLVPGSVILSLDDQPVEHRIIEYYERNHSSSESARRDAFFYLLALYDGDDRISVGFFDPDGAQKSITLSFVEPADRPVDPALDSAPLITAERLESGVAVIRIPTFSSGRGHDLVAEFDGALDSVFDAPAIILDLRGNGGGNTSISDPIAGRFLNETFVYGRETFRFRLPQRLWRSNFEYTVRPRRPVYAGAVALIADWTNASTAENFLVALVDSGRAFTVGRNTAGSSGNPVHFRLPGGDCQFSTGDFRRLNGRPIEGKGIAPDIRVALSVDDLVQQRDAFLEAAEAALLEAIH